MGSENRHKLMKSIGILTLLAVLTSPILNAQEPLPSVFDNHRGNKWYAYKNNNEALYKIISDEAYLLLDRRTDAIAKIETLSEWNKYRAEARDKLFNSMNKFSRTPLNYKITGKIELENLTVEKVIFESHPEFYVTGCLFLPKQRQNPAPAVIYCSGHTSDAFRAELYQLSILNLVDKGFIVFAYDPIGQGERLQYVDRNTGKAKIGLNTLQHSYAGMQTLMAGTSITDYFVWDGSRAVDFLVARKEVDPTRIGIMGRSGGGTQSAMIAAYDDRIYAAAPEAWITNFKRLFQSIGPGDAEQNPFQIIKNGMDYPDYLHLRAPKPSLIVTTTHDFFSIHGARETFREASISYEAFGHSRNLQMVENMGIHESTKDNRQTVYAFFQKHLALPGDRTEKDVITFKPEELQVTPTGQICTSMKCKTVYELNQQYFSKDETLPKQLQKRIMDIAGISFDRKLTSAVYTGKLRRDHFEVGKYFLENNKKDYALPVYVVKKPNVETSKTLVWLTNSGKDSVINTSLMLELLDAGFKIISADLPGIGELHDPEYSGDGFIDGIPNNYTFGAHMVGKSIPGIRAEAIDLLMQFVGQEDADQAPNALIQGTVGSAFLHFTALNNPFKKIVLTDMMESARSLMDTKYYDPLQAFSIVPGSLRFYDFEDLIAMLDSDKFKVVSTIGPERHSRSIDIDNSEIIQILNND
jgi:hypothetical protein